jgi:hypothetical protein
MTAPDPGIELDPVIARLRVAIARLALFAFATGVWCGVVEMALWGAGRCVP